MKPEFRNRAFYPVVIPLAVLGAMATIIGLVAYALLYNTHSGALVLATVAAAGVLFTFSLAVSQERVDTGRRAAVVFAGALPVLLGLAFGAGLLGDIADEDRNINAEPEFIFPEDAPVIAAENSNEFCLPTDVGCEATDTWEIDPSTEVEEIAYVFNNMEAGVQHNVVLAELEGSEGDPEAGEDIFASELVTGPVVDEAFSEEETWEDAPDQMFFYCEVHPPMTGVATVSGGGEDVEDDGGESEDGGGDG